MTSPLRSMSAIGVSSLVVPPNKKIAERPRETDTIGAFWKGSASSRCPPMVDPDGSSSLSQLQLVGCSQLLLPGRSLAVQDRRGTRSASSDRTFSQTTGSGIPASPMQVSKASSSGRRFLACALPRQTLQCPLQTGDSRSGISLSHQVTPAMSEALHGPSGVVRLTIERGI
eukprot:CAMPEP_0182810180 /NCGR_PEP_ID=MMETSP0006_2-20121128/7590_1 /TAXON_ID=97485 /ORGANISM="Prymnesium parvum, Strain Texoma1" /LENGTH=170 /DNA_ID=CAMNT_0024936035 /DNA_START=325 /DNA_END=838 /DNA_ORIENTATION=-